MDMKFSNILFLLQLCFASMAAQNCEVFPEIDEESDEFDTEYSSIMDADARPLGFVRETAYYNPDPEDATKEDPCYTVSGVEDRYIEILFETIPPSVLCFRDQLGNEKCSDTKHQECVPALDSSMQYTFYNDVGSGSSEADITFWLRIYKGPPRAEDTENMWCQWRDNFYPESLRELPAYVRVATPMPTPSAAPPTVTQALCVFLASLLAALALTY